MIITIEMKSIPLFNALIAFVVCISLVFKCDNLYPQSALVWAKNFGGLNFDYGSTVTVDVLGNTYVAGTFQGVADFDPGAGVYNLSSAGMQDIFVTKLSASGTFLWAKRIGGTNSDDVTSITVDLIGNTYLTGAFTGTVDFDPGLGVYNLTGIGQADIFICKLDSMGNFVWAKSMEGTGIAYSISLDGKGYVFTCGYYSNTVDFDPGVGVFNLTNSGTFISKLDTSGTFVWVKGIGGSTTGYSVGVDTLGDVYVTGRFKNTVDFDPNVGVVNLTAPGNYYNTFVFKMDPTGSLLWAKLLGADYSYALAVDVAGNVYTTGNFGGTTDFDPGAGIYNLTAGYIDIFVSKLDASGNFLWAKNMGRSDPDVGKSIAVDASGNVYTTGNFIRTTDFDPGVGFYNLTASGNDDIFISKLNSSGTFVWAVKIGGDTLDYLNSSDMGLSVAVDASENVYVTGWFNTSGDFDPGLGTFTLTSNGNKDVFVVKLDNTVGIEDRVNSMNEVSLYPNPSNGLLTIEATFPKKETLNLTLYDVLGTEVMNFDQVIAEGVYRKEVNIEMLPSGVYFLSIQCDNNISMKKVIKQ
jgi:hypothetical protein